MAGVAHSAASETLHGLESRLLPGLDRPACGDHVLARKAPPPCMRLEQSWSRAAEAESLPLPGVGEALPRASDASSRVNHDTEAEPARPPPWRGGVKSDHERKGRRSLFSLSGGQVPIPAGRRGRARAAGIPR